jgi:hypothetical protein
VAIDTLGGFSGLFLLVRLLLQGAEASEERGAALFVGWTLLLDNRGLGGAVSGCTNSRSSVSSGCLSGLLVLGLILLALHLLDETSEEVALLLGLFGLGGRLDDGSSGGALCGLFGSLNSCRGSDGSSINGLRIDGLIDYGSSLRDRRDLGGILRRSGGLCLRLLSRRASDVLLAEERAEDGASLSLLVSRSGGFGLILLLLVGRDDNRGS